MEYHLMFVRKEEVIFCFGSYLSQKLMDFASIWVILKAKSCWATISEYIRNTNMKLNEYGISEYAKNPYPLDALPITRVRICTAIRAREQACHVFLVCQMRARTWRRDTLTPRGWLACAVRSEVAAIEDHAR